MDSIQKQIEDIEEVLRKTPHHKATNGFIGLMRAKIARLKDKEYEYASKGKGGGGGGYAVKKTGDASVALVGPPSAGKSTLLNKLTNAQSRVAEYAFTTVSVIPGMMFYKDAYIQIFDIPGLIEGASIGKGRGKEVISVARNADLLIIISDVDRIDYIEKIKNELYKAGIRLNLEKPNVRIEKKLSGGIVIHSNIKQEFDSETVKNVANEFGLKNAEITIREKLSIDRLIDAFSSSRIYIPSISLINKIDKAKGKKIPEGVMGISAQEDIGLNSLKEEIWKALDFATIYLVKPDEDPSENDPMIVKNGITLKETAEFIGEEFALKTTSAKIWGPGAIFPGQEVSLSTKIKEKMMIRFI